MVVELQDSGWHFMKMHGLGNDFVVVDQRGHSGAVSPQLARALADRHRGVGFDQMAVIEHDDETDIKLTFLNADGSLSGACGNATRCIAQWEMAATNKDQLTLRTQRGVLRARLAEGGLASVNMGQPMMRWDEIPLSQDTDTLHLPIPGDPVATGMGNPHCTFFVEDASVVDLEKFGAEHETHPLFPEKTNVQIVQVLGKDHLRMRVWERGVGITLASGSSSCAVAVAAARRGLTGRTVLLELDGGNLQVEWHDDGVWITGHTAHVFSGTLTREFLEGLQ